RKIYQRMCEMSDEQRPIDPMTVYQELQRHQESEAVGGIEYVVGLTDGMPRVSNIEYYARLVKEKSTLRKVIQASHEAMPRSMEAFDQPKEIIDDLQSTLLTLTLNGSDGFQAASDLVMESFKEIEARAANKNMVTGLETGLTDLDRMTGGFRPGN